MNHNFRELPKVRKQIKTNTDTKIHTPKPHREKYKWDWRKEIDCEDLKALGINYE